MKGSFAIACIGDLERRRRHDNLPTATMAGLPSWTAALPCALSTRCPIITFTSGLIAALFPRATLIYCRRDFRYVAVSCWLTGFRSVRWTNATEHIASRYHQHF